MENIEALREEVLAEIEKAADLQALEDVRISALGKKGRITGLMKNLGQMDPDQRREFGQTLNTVKDQVAEAIETRKSGLEDAALNARLVGERIDVTLPAGHLLSARAGRRVAPCAAHPYLAGADQNHAEQNPANPDHRAGADISFR